MTQYDLFVADIRRRFWSKVEDVSFLSDEDCWSWIGNRNSAGYGMLSVRDKGKLATRISYWLHVDMCQSTLLNFNGNNMVCHHCDNPACINPHHLFVGTRRANMQDAKRKNRIKAGNRHWNVKLTEDVVTAIRKEYQPYKNSQAILAAKYGVSKTGIQSILERRTWNHI